MVYGRERQQGRGKGVGMSGSRMNTMGRLYAEATEWKARYNALAAEVEVVHVEAADLLIRKAIALHKEFGMSPSDALRTLILASKALSESEKEGGRNGEPSSEA